MSRSPPASASESESESSSSSSSSGTGERAAESAPIDPQSILEGMVSISSPLALETLAEGDGEQGAEGGDSGSGVVLYEPPNMTPVEPGKGTPEADAAAGATPLGQDAKRDSAVASEGETPSPAAGKSDLGKNVVELQSASSAPGGRCSVYLVGTTHMSQESCDEVRAVIRHVKPKVVFLELCASRVTVLMPQKWKAPSLSEMVSSSRKRGHTPLGVVISWFLARIADKVDISPGAEFKAASEEALACGARVMLGDRPIQITLRRTWVALDAWHKAKLIFGLIFQGLFPPSTHDMNQMIEEMNDTDMVTALVEELSKGFPTLKETLVHERDLFMTAVLRGVAQNTSTVVAVVGRGHLQGMSDNWEKETSLEELMTIPAKKSWYSQPVLFWGVTTFAVGGLAVVFGLVFNQKRPQIARSD